MNFTNYSAATSAALAMALLCSFIISGSLGVSITCIDEPEDYLHNQFNFELLYPVNNFSSSCHDDSCIPVTLTDNAGETGNASGFLVLHPPSGNRLRLGWDDEDTEGTAYFYIRYYIQASPPVDGNNASAAAHFSHETCEEPPCELDTTQDQVWKEHCAVGKPGLATQPGRFLQYHNYFEPNNYGDFMVIDKIIYVRLGPNVPELQCGPNEVENIQRFCSENPPTYTTDSPITTESSPEESPQPSGSISPAFESPTTFWTTTEEPFSTPLPEATSVTCIDHLKDYEEHGWSINKWWDERNASWTYCDDASCIPFQLTDDTNQESSGFMVLNPDQLQSHIVMFWNAYDHIPTEIDYFYIRYYVHGLSFLKIFDPFPCEYNSSRGCLEFDLTPNRIWKEACFQGEPKKTRYNDVFEYKPSPLENDISIMVIDKMISVRVRPKDAKLRCSTKETDDIKQYCNWRPPTTTIPPSTSTSTLGSSPEPSSTSAMPTSTATSYPPITSSEPPLTSPTASTSTTPLPGEPDVETEWVDFDSDLRNYAWSTSNSLKYVLNTTDLPFAISRNLTGASGLFYFHGKPEASSEVQEISRSKSSKAGEANLYIRYYIHHTSPTDSHRYYVSPVEDKFEGVHYLDATSDLRWKEALLHLEVDQSDVSFRIGTTNDDEDQDIFVIDKVIFTQRLTD